MPNEPHKKRKHFSISASEQMQRFLDSLNSNWSAPGLSSTADPIAQIQSMIHSLTLDRALTTDLASIQPSQSLVHMLESMRPPEMTSAIASLEKSMQHAAVLGISESTLQSISTSLRPMPASLITMIETAASSRQFVAPGVGEQLLQIQDALARAHPEMGLFVMFGRMSFSSAAA